MPKIFILKVGYGPAANEASCLSECTTINGCNYYSYDATRGQCILTEDCVNVQVILDCLSIGLFSPYTIHIAVSN